MFNEWKNKILRTSIAKSSLMKVKSTSSKNYFSKGKVLIIFFI
jgi:hypothetical protein